MAIKTLHDPLAELRPIHWPDPISWWPIAIGWWVLLALLLLTALLLWRRFRAQRPLRAAHTTLKRLQTREIDNQQFVSELNRTLKRIALLKFPAHRVAILSGEQWLAFLDATGGDGAFCHGIGQVLAAAPYQQEPEITDRKALLMLARRWATRAFKPKRRHS